MLARPRINTYLNLKMTLLRFTCIFYYNTTKPCLPYDLSRLVNNVVLNVCECLCSYVWYFVDRYSCMHVDYTEIRPRLIVSYIIIHSPLIDLFSCCDFLSVFSLARYTLLHEFFVLYICKRIIHIYYMYHWHNGLERFLSILYDSTPGKYTL